MMDKEITSYVSGLLTEFNETEKLYRIRDSAGQPIQDVGTLLLHSDPVFGEASSFEREREVRKHIGDFTLFFAGAIAYAV